MSVIKRVTLTLSIGLIGMLLVGFCGLWQLNSANQRFDYLMANTIPSIKVLTDALHNYSKIRIEVLKYTLATNTDMQNISKEAIATLDKKFDADIADYLENDISNDIDRQMLETDKASIAAYRAIRDKAMAAVVAGKRDEAIGLLIVDVAKVANILNKNLQDHLEFNYNNAKELAKSNQESFTESINISLGVIVLALIVACFLGVRLFNIIRSGLKHIQSALEKVSQTHDFTHRATVAHNDEIGQTATLFNTLLENLQFNLKEVLKGAQEVANVAQELSQAAVDVSKSSSMQSESSANMAATVEEMTVSINHVAERALETQTLTVDAGKLVNDGSTIIGQTIKDIHEISSVVNTSAESIRELETYSGQVSSVINVIREIADQTNLLALNAAIEAARAGEQGRGFAVVADEVRKLAERTARSTQEISSTIETMVSRSQHATTQMQEAERLVNHGVKRADEADQAIKRIGERSSATSNMVDEINTAIHQQGTASNNIAVEVERTAQMSEESSATAQRTAETASRLDQLARQQMTTLSRYML